MGRVILFVYSLPSENCNAENPKWQEEINIDPLSTLHQQLHFTHVEE